MADADGDGELDFICGHFSDHGAGEEAVEALVSVCEDVEAFTGFFDHGHDGGAKDEGVEVITDCADGAGDASIWGVADAA